MSASTTAEMLPILISWREILRTPDRNLRRLLAERYRATSLEKTHKPDRREQELTYEIARLELAAALTYEARLHHPTTT